MTAVRHPAHCRLLLLLLLLQTMKLEMRESRRWRMHWPRSKIQTAHGHTTMP